MAGDLKTSVLSKLGIIMGVRSLWEYRLYVLVASAIVRLLGGQAPNGIGGEAGFVHMPKSSLSVCLSLNVLNVSINLVYRDF